MTKSRHSRSRSRRSGKSSPGSSSPKDDQVEVTDLHKDSISLRSAEPGGTSRTHSDNDEEDVEVAILKQSADSGHVQSSSKTRSPHSAKSHKSIEQDIRPEQNSTSTEPRHTHSVESPRPVELDVEEDQDDHVQIEEVLRAGTESAEKPQANPASSHENNGTPVRDPREAYKAPADPWGIVFDEFKSRDENMAKEYREEIDTLLVVAGLFSAVLTAFVIESYQSLQEDYTETSAALLMQISRQLTNSSFSSDARQFQVKSADVRVNILWFMSLVLSLVVALFGIFLKQWIRTYMKWMEVTPESEAIALRQYRYIHLESWNLGLVLTVLPVLLQAAVILFLSGLLIFLWNLNRVVAIAITILGAFCLSLVVIVTILPVFKPSCPYKSPLSELLLVSKSYAVCHICYWHHNVVQWINVHARSQAARHPLDSERGTPFVDASNEQKPVQQSSWETIDQNAMAIRRRLACIDPSIEALCYLCCTTRSEPVWLNILTCMNQQYSRLGLVRQDFATFEIWWSVTSHVLDCSTRPGIRGVEAIETRASSLSQQVVDGLFRLFENPFQNLFNIPIADKDIEKALVIATTLAFTSKLSRARHRGQCFYMIVMLFGEDLSQLPESQVRGMSDYILSTLMSMQEDSSVELSIQETLTIIRAIKFYCKTNKGIYGYVQTRDVLLQFAIYAVYVATKGSSDPAAENCRDQLKALLSFVNAQPQVDSSHVTTLIRLSAQAVVELARHEPKHLPSSFLRGIRKFTWTNLRAYPGEWEQVLDAFQDLIYDSWSWISYNASERADQTAYRN